MRSLWMMIVLLLLRCPVYSWKPFQSLGTLSKISAARSIVPVILGAFLSFQSIHPSNADNIAPATPIPAEEILRVSQTKKVLDAAQTKVLTLSAYLDELERNIVTKDWNKVLIYSYTFAEQDNSFVTLIDGLFPSNDALDKATRAALTYEAREMFNAIDNLLDAAKAGDFLMAQKSYSKLILNYDHFLKAGSLYPEYDPITSTEIFFASTPLNALQFDKDTPCQLLDRVLILGGPDMGKLGKVLWIRSDSKSAVVKLDKNGGSYYEVKVMKLSNLGKQKAQVQQPSEPKSVVDSEVRKLKNLR